MSATYRASGSPRHAWLRWGGAAAIVLAAHAAGAWFVLQREPEPSAGEAAPAILVELEPLPVAAADEPVETVADTEPDPVPPEPVDETPPPTPEPIIDLPPPPEPAEPVFDEAKVPEVPPPPPPPAPRPEVVIPEPKPEPPKVDPPKQPAKKPARQPPKPKPSPKKAKKPRDMAPPPRQRAAPAAPKPGSGAASLESSTAPANWRGLLLAHLNRARRYPAEARQRREEGTVRLSFSIDRGGRVMGYRIVHSSGSEALDREALAMIQRASPLPAPPPAVPGTRINLIVPIHFNLD